MERSLIERRPPDVADGTARSRRVLLYSHDTFGLGHLRRSRTIAHALAGAHADVEVAIVSGSAVLDRYAFAEGVDTVRIPAVVKGRDGTYASLDAGVPLERVVAERARIIARTAEEFRPDLVIVDKEPTGFHGEMLPALESAAARGCRVVLGLRDVLDETARLIPEWERKGACAALRRYYDEVWIYGVPRVHEPLAGMPIGAEIADRTVYTGYLRRSLPDGWAAARSAPPITQAPFLLVTPGGGGDGDGLIDWVISAYEADPGIPLPSLIAFGPFVAAASRARFLERIARLPGKLAAIDFDSEIERLMARAAGVVAMGGYNTFCEILSFDKRAILVPRSEPRREQTIRAEAAHALGLARALLEEDGRSPRRMAEALRALPDQSEPSRIVVPGLLDGLEGIARRFGALTAAPVPAPALPQAACL